MRKPLSLLLILLGSCTTDDDPTSSIEQASLLGSTCHLTLPHRMYPTIRSALDAVPTGGTLCLQPGTYLGDFTVTRSLTLRTVAGATSRATIGARVDGVAEARILVMNGGVHFNLIDVDITGGLGGIRSVAAASYAVRPIVNLLNVTIAGSRANGGVSGRMHLKGRNLLVDQAEGDGIAISGVADLKDVYVSNSGSGIAVSESGFLPAGWQRQLVGVITATNGGPGAWLAGAAYRVESSIFFRSRGFGLLLENAGGSKVVGSSAAETRPRADGEFGDGFTVFGAGSVSLTEIDSSASARAGISVFGCPSLHPTVTVTGSEIYDNPINLTASVNAYCPMSPTPDMFKDGGGNLCSGGPCNVLAGTLAAPEQAPRD